MLVLHIIPIVVIMLHIDIRKNLGGGGWSSQGYYRLASMIYITRVCDKKPECCKHLLNENKDNEQTKLTVNFVCKNHQQDFIPVVRW